MGDLRVYQVLMFFVMIMKKVKDRGENSKGTIDTEMKLTDQQYMISNITIFV